MGSDKAIRTFACDCAERLLPAYEERHPKERRPREIIRVWRLHANKKATDRELKRVTRIDPNKPARKPLSSISGSLDEIYCILDELVEEGEYASPFTSASLITCYIADFAAYYATLNENLYKEGQWQINREITENYEAFK